jgi:GntR family transcriptional regulator, transcriptional repressor for pyruvate dehydrogenase complex
MSDPADAAAFTPVKTRRGYQYILEQLREAITSNRYKPGDRLPAEREMAQIFGVSRQGVREAVRGLESTGLVEIRLGVLGGVFVRDGDPSTVTRAMSDLVSLGALSSASLLEARILLTTDVIRLACQRANEEDLQRLEEDIALTERDVAKPGATRTAQIAEFYRILASATHNEVLVLLMDSLAQIVNVRVNRALPKPDPSVGTIRRSILEHIRAGRAEDAVAELTQHLTRLEKRLLAAEKRRKVQE